MGEAVYMVSEFASRAREIFDTTPEAVTVAFQTVGVKEATIEEAKKIVKTFLEKEVR